MCARVRAYDIRFTAPKLSFLCEEEGICSFSLFTVKMLYIKTHTHGGRQAGRRCLISAIFWVNSVVIALPGLMEFVRLFLKT